MMIAVPVLNMSGEQTGSMEIDEASLGGAVRPKLLKQAIVMWQANQRQGSAATKSRGMVAGSTKKLYRQKGTGNARMGSSRTPIRRGGGMAFAKRPREFRQAMPKKMRRLARNSALLAKLRANEAAVVDPLSFDKPRTKDFARMLKAVGAERGVLLAMHEPNDAILKSGRNIPKTDIRLVTDLNAYEVLRRAKVLFTREAFAAIVGDPVTYRGVAQEE